MVGAVGTVIALDPLTLPEVAVIVAVPNPRAVARPELTPTTLEFDEAQVAAAVRFCVLPSAKVPVAVNCWEELKERFEFAGVMVMETSDGGATVSALPAIIPVLALA